MTVGKTFEKRFGKRAMSPVISTVVLTGAIVALLSVALIFANGLLWSKIAEGEFNSAKQFMHTVGLTIDDVAWTVGRTETIGYSSRDGDITIESSTLDYVVNVETTDGGEITSDNSAKGSSSISPLTFQYSIGSGSNRILIVGVGWEDSTDGKTVTEVTYDGESLTKIADEDTHRSGSTNAYVWLGYLLEEDLPSSGSHDVVVTASASPSRTIFGYAISYFGVKQAAPDDYDTDYHTDGTPCVATVTSAADGSVGVVVGASGATGAASGNNDATVRQSHSQDSSAGAIGDEQDVSSGSNDMGITFAGQNRAALVGAILQPAGITYQFSYETGVLLFNIPTSKYSVTNGYWELIFPSQNDTLTLKGTSAPVVRVFAVEKLPMGDGSYIRVVVAPSIRFLSSTITISDDSTHYAKLYLPVLTLGSAPRRSQTVTLTGNSVEAKTVSGVTRINVTVSFPKGDPPANFDASFFNFPSLYETIEIPGTYDESVFEFYVGEVTVDFGIG